MRLGRFPEMFHARSGYVVEEFWHGGCRVRKHFHQARCVRAARFPATMMALADFGIYVAILATVGWVPAAVTTNLNINFLEAARGTSWPRRADQGGNRLAVAEIGIRSDGARSWSRHRNLFDSGGAIIPSTQIIETRPEYRLTGVLAVAR